MFMAEFQCMRSMSQFSICIIIAILKKRLDSVIIRVISFVEPTIILARGSKIYLGVWIAGSNHRQSIRVNIKMNYRELERIS